MSDQGGAGALGDGLLGDGLLPGGYGVDLHHRVVLVVELEQVGGYSDADGVAFTTVTIHFHSHDNLLTVLRCWADPQRPV
ncbi:hypothetical protein ASG82_08645 [Mycobacterium sp. Soil538]|nr:hypothetical protein ASG82_08645 [Mycobacterium sp. Soil538]